MSHPKPLAVRTDDSQDLQGNAYSDWNNVRPLLYAAKFSWTKDSDGVPQFKQVDNTLGAWGSFLYLKPGGTSRKLGQWAAGGVLCKVTSTGPLKVTPVKNTSFALDADLSDFAVTAVTGYSPANGDLVVARQLSDLGADQVVISPTSSGSPNGSGVNFVDIDHTFTGSEPPDPTVPGSGPVFIGTIPITGEFYYWGMACYTVTTLVDGGTPGWNPPLTSTKISIGGPAADGVSSGQSAVLGDGLTHDVPQKHGPFAGDWINGHSREIINNQFNNGYYKGYIDTLGGSDPRGLWFYLLDNSANISQNISGGRVKIRIWYWQTPTQPADLIPPP
jgi:hypothetical protein